MIPSRYTLVVKIMCAPDSFKESLAATEVAEAMAMGIRAALPDAHVDLCPIADGGEGTLSAFATALRGDIHSLIVHGPLAAPLEAAFAVFPQQRFAVVESAAAIGLQLVPLASRDPEKTSSFGVGELLVAACASGQPRIIAGIGGSASCDGGCGMAQALGVRFFDRDDALIERPITGGMLLSVARIDLAYRLDTLDGIELVVASDVHNPLTGADGAAAVYGPQKGATAAQVLRLDAGLAHIAALILRDLGLDVEKLPGSGAAGGLGAGMVAFAGATLASGIDTVLEVTDFARRVQDCDLCLTGEGKIDAQSLSGKACMGVARTAQRCKVPTVALVGATGDGAQQCLQAGLDDIVVIGEGRSAEDSMRHARTLIANAAGQVAKKYRSQGQPG